MSSVRPGRPAPRTPNGGPGTLLPPPTPSARRCAAHRRGPRIAAALAAAALLLGLLLTPAGARVGDWIGEVVSPAPEATRSALASLPAEGRLLVVAESGPWVVGDDGARRRLGAYRDAAWSPGGLYVVAAKGRRLIALEPDGDERWTRVAPARVATPRWSPDGFRIAYRSGHDLHVAIGDNSDSWLLRTRRARGAAGLAPRRAGQPSGTGVRARAPRLHRAGRSGRGIPLAAGPYAARTGPAPAVVERTGPRLIAVSARGVRIYDPRGRPLRSIPLARGLVASESALAPDGRRLALIASVPGAALERAVAVAHRPPRAAAEAPRGLWPAGGLDLVDRRAGARGRLAAGRPVAVPAPARAGRARIGEGHPLQVPGRAPRAQRRLSPPGGLVLRGAAESGRVEPLALLLKVAQPQL